MVVKVVGTVSEETGLTSYTHKTDNRARRKKNRKLGGMLLVTSEPATRQQ